MVLINIQNFDFSPYKIKLHFLVPMTFFLSILGTENADVKFLQGLKILIENKMLTKFSTGTKTCDFIL